MTDKITRQLKLADAKTWPNQAKEALTVAWGMKKDLILTIKPDEESRSQKQNRLLWLLHGELAKHIQQHQGEIYDTDDIHEYVIGRLLPRRAVTMPDKEPVILRASTRKLAVKDFAELLDKYYAWAADSMQCVLPMPADLYFDALMKNPPAELQSGDGL